MSEEQDDRDIAERLSNWAMHDSGLYELEVGLGQTDKQMPRIAQAARQLGWEVDPASAVRTLLLLNTPESAHGLVQAFVAGGGLERLADAWRRAQENE